MINTNRILLEVEMESYVGIPETLVKDIGELWGHKRNGGLKVEIGYRSKNSTKHSIRNISLKKLVFFSGLLLWIMQEYIMRTKYLEIFGYGPCTVLRLIALTLLVSKIAFLDTKYSVKLFCFSIICCMIMIISQFTSKAESSNTMLNVLIICIPKSEL